MRSCAAALLLVGSSLNSYGQQFDAKLRLGVAAGIDRQFIYSQNFATISSTGSSNHEHMQGFGQFGPTGAIYCAKSLRPRIAVYGAGRFSYNSSLAQLTQTIPQRTQITYEWIVRQNTYSLLAGASYTFVTKRNKQFYTKLGLVSTLESRNTSFEKITVAPSTSSPRIYSYIDYTRAPNPLWIGGADLGLGMRLFDDVDVGVSYTYNFTKSKILTYTAERGSRQGAPDVQVSSGKLDARLTYISAELLVWLRKHAKGTLSKN